MSTTPLAEHSSSIAIVGMAARLPGASSVQEYWRNLCEGVESVQFHSREEAIERGMAAEIVDDPYYVNASAPLTDAECFDAAFFGYSAREAEVMEPQHRVFLECAYHALENAGYDSRHYDGLIGVYGGCTMNTYLLYNLMPHSRDIAGVVGDLQTMIGNDKDYLTTRVSYKLDLRGPSMAVQSACSTSLVAVHMASRALLDHECDVALAGGASVRMPHGAGYLSNPGGTSSPDGHCRAFDVGAAGSVLGNGVGIVVLKRLADAIRDGDEIAAVIRGSAIGNDGQSKASFTAPSIAGQSRSVLRALERAEVSARDIRVVEAHGTGTPLGDPIEVAAIARAFGESTSDTNYCYLGSTKPNIGHLDAAAGIAGLIKAVMILQHRKVPPVLHFTKPNPKFEIEKTPFLIPAELTTLDVDGPLLVSVNSLAMGGTNAHVVLEEAPATPPSERSLHRRQPVLLSARSADALEQLSQSVGQFALENPATPLADIAYTLATGRRDWEHRRVLVAEEPSDVRDALSVRGSRRQQNGQAVGPPRFAFVLAGQGAQRVAMGARLASQEPRFGSHLNQVLDLFQEVADLDVQSVIYPAADTDPALAQASLTETDHAQPALFAVEWALGQTLLDYGLRPYALIGHSIGELVAATLAGVFSIRSAIAVVAARGRLMADTPPAAMMYVNLSEDEVAVRIAEYELGIAAVNAPKLVVVSGEEAEIERLAVELAAEDVSHGRLEVTRAFHSPLMGSAAEGLVAEIGRHELSAPKLPVVSNVTGRYLSVEQATSPQYWGEQLRQPVRFADGLAHLSGEGVSCYLEIGPAGSVSSLLRGLEGDPMCLQALEPVGGQEPRDLLGLLTRFWLAGGDVDWAAYYGGEQRRRIALPLYPFARTRHWLEARPGQHDAPQAPASTPAAKATSPQAPRDAAPEASTSGQAPWPPMQSYLRSLWSDLLGTELGSPYENFFEAGGHSLLAMQMVTRLRRDGAGDLAMTTVFEVPTIAQLATHLESIGMSAPGPQAVESDPRDQVAEIMPADSADQGDRVGGVEAKLADDDASALWAEVSKMPEAEVVARLAELDRQEDL